MDWYLIWPSKLARGQRSATVRTKLHHVPYMYRHVGVWAASELTREVSTMFEPSRLSNIAAGQGEVADPSMLR